jgi:EmrB/QacA subfamily drug resistance transporter
MRQTSPALLRSLLTERARPQRIAGSRHAHWLVVAAVCVGAFMGQLDVSVVSLAFPTLQHVFRTTVGAVQWVGLSYLLILVSTVPAVGRLADTVGRKALYIYGFIFFALGSALCGIAPDLATLDCFRALQAVGAALLQANSVAIIVLAVPRTQLGRAIGVQGTAQALGLSLGPAIGGLLIAAGGWRLIFLINVPIGVLGTIAGWYLIPRSRYLRPSDGFDLRGLALFVPATSGLLLALSYGNQIGWASLPVLSAFALAIVCGVAFLSAERSALAPMIDLRLFRRRAFAAGVWCGLLSYLVLFGALFVTPFYLESVRGLSVAATGGLVATLPITLGLIAPFAGHFADRIGPRLPTVAGMLASALALVLLSTLHSFPLAVGAALSLLGAGLGLFTSANTAAIMGAAPPEQSGAAGGVVNVARGLGTSLGLSLTALVFGIFAGRHATPGLVTRGFESSTLFLAGVATVSALIASLGSSRADSSATTLHS